MRNPLQPGAVRALSVAAFNALSDDDLATYAEGFAFVVTDDGDPPTITVALRVGEGHGVQYLGDLVLAFGDPGDRPDNPGRAMLYVSEEGTSVYLAGYGWTDVGGGGGLPSYDGQPAGNTLALVDDGEGGVEPEWQTPSGPILEVLALTSLDGFTQAPGDGSIAVDVGGLVLTLPAGTSLRESGDYTGPAVTRYLGAVVTIDACVRITAAPSAADDVRCTLELCDVLSGGNRVCARAMTDGTVELYDQLNNTVLATTAAGALDLSGGDAWIRVRSVNGFVEAFYGEGTSRPSGNGWFSVGLSAFASLFQTVGVGMECVGTGGATVVRARDLTIYALYAATL